MASILLLFRQFHSWDQIKVSDLLSITVEEYNDLETGLTKVEMENAIKLSKLYMAPEEVFLNNNSNSDLCITYSNCNFHGSNGYVNHLFQQETQQIRNLKSEISRLQEHNIQLLKLLLRDKKISVGD
jgi:plasmid maintenance system antidote protein VapI